jgi:hypothetical protein
VQATLLLSASFVMPEIHPINFRLLPCLSLYRPGYPVTLVEGRAGQVKSREMRVRNAFLLSLETSVVHARGLLSEMRG